MDRLAPAYSPRTTLRTGRLTAFQDEKRAFQCGMWFLAVNENEKAMAWCQENNLPVTKAAGGTIGSTGGYVVPKELMREIIALRELTGSFRAAARIVPMASNMSDVPRRDGGLTGYFPDENSAVTESQGTWGNVSLNAKKLATLSRSSSELDEDAVIDWGEFFATEIAYTFAVKEDQCGWNGDGGPTYGGMIGVCPRLLDGNHNAGKVVAASGHDTFGEIDAADLISLISMAPALALSGARWFISQLGFALTFCRLASAAGGIISQVINGRNVLSFMGFPVQLTQALPQVASDISGQVMLAFGDLSLAATLGERRGVTIARSDQRYLEFDQVAWRGTERVDIVIHDLGDSTTAGPIVGLVGE